MRKYNFSVDGFNFERINKRTARQAYNNGLTVLFCPVNLRPGSVWRLDMPINKNNQNCEGCSFDSVLNAFENYNCTGSETGRYSAFYVPVEYVDRFTGEAPTAETLGTVKQYNYKYMEV